MLGIGAGVIPFTTNNKSGGGTGAVDSVVVNVSSPDGTVNQPDPSSCQVVDGVAIVDVALTSQQGQQNAVKQITTPAGVLKPDQVSGNVTMDAGSLFAYTKAQTDAQIAPVAQDANDAKGLATEAKQESAAAKTIAQGANTKSDQALAKVNEIVINLNAIQGNIISNTISGTLVFDYTNKQIVLTEEVNVNSLPFVQSVNTKTGKNITLTPADIDTYSKQQIDDEFASQEQAIEVNAQNINALTLKYNAQTGVITSPDGTVVGSMNFDNLTGKWTLSLRATGSGASTIVESDNLDVTAITGGYKINLNINPEQLQFIDKILNVIGGSGGVTPEQAHQIAKQEAQANFDTNIKPIQQEIDLLNLDMFFADYYIGISINYLLSGKWETDAQATYNAILAQLQDNNNLKFTLTNGTGTSEFPLIITKQQFIDFANLDNFTDYIATQMQEQYQLTLAVGFNVFDNIQGFFISNLDDNYGITFCAEENDNLAVIMKLTELTGAINRLYTEFSDNSLQAQIDNVKDIADTAVQSVNGKTGNAISLTAGDVNAYTKAQTDAAIGVVAASVTGLQTEVNAVKRTADSATQQITSTDQSVVVTYNGRNADLSVAGGKGASTNATLTTELIATPKATTYSNQNYNYGQNWIVTLKYISSLCEYPKLYVTRLNIATSGNTSGGSYGIYQSYSADAYNDLISGSGLTPSAIYSALSANSGLTLSVVGKTQALGVQTPKSAYSGASDMNAVAAILQTQMKASQFLSNATCIWNGTNLVLSSGDTEWNFDLAQDWGGDCSNTVFGLTPQTPAGAVTGARLLPNSFGGLLEIISFDAHDGSSNPARLSKAYTPFGSNNTFTIEIYENGTFLADVGQYATLTYGVTDSGLMTVNQNKTYNNRYVAIWDNTKVSIAASTEINSVIACTAVNMKKASPYKNLYFTAIGSASGSLGNGLLMLVPSLDYGCTNPVGQPIRVGQGGANGVYEDEFIRVNFVWRFPTQSSPYNIYAGNSPAFTITNATLSNASASALGYVVDANRLSKSPSGAYYETFSTTGLLDRSITAEIVATLSAQVYNNNFLILPYKSVILNLSASAVSNSGNFQVYFLMNRVNYTQSFKTIVMVPFATGSSYTNCKFRLILGNNTSVNGIPKTNYVDLTVPATINAGQTLVFNFEVIYNEISGLNINWSQNVVPSLSMSQELGGYVGKTEGQSNLALGLDALVSGYKLMPEIGNATGITKSIQNIGGLDYYIFTLKAGIIYNLILSGYIAFSDYYDSSDNPLLIGLILMDYDPLAPEYYALPVQCSTSYASRQNINPNNEVVQIDLTNAESDKVFRVLMSTANAVSGCVAIISDNITLNFKDNADGI